MLGRKLSLTATSSHTERRVLTKTTRLSSLSPKVSTGSGSSKLTKSRKDRSFSSFPPMKSLTSSPWNLRKPQSNLISKSKPRKYKSLIWPYKNWWLSLRTVTSKISSKMCCPSRKGSFSAWICRYAKSYSEYWSWWESRSWSKSTRHQKWRTRLSRQPLTEPTTWSGK